ncbi:MAG TPA: hypothetical protein VHT27_07665 [Solirubrobacteraceae bacterium]|nr:hypothetical protein [Solirubrobacteraceae bacterium]
MKRGRERTDGLRALGAAAVLLLAAAASAQTLRRRRRAPARPAEIVGLSDATSVDRETGAVRSVQRADLVIDREALAEIWDAAHLERLARTYWRFLTRVTLGLIRVCYNAEERWVVLLARPFRLLTFHAPEYELEGDRGLVRWRIARGMLVARRGRGRGYLQIEARRGPDGGGERLPLHVEVAVANFYPAIASGISLRVYDITQSRIHVIITYGFLRSLVRLDLAQSRTGRFRAQPPA